MVDNWRVQHVVAGSVFGRNGCFHHIASIVVLLYFFLGEEFREELAEDTKGYESHGNFFIFHQERKRTPQAGNTEQSVTNAPKQIRCAFEEGISAEFKDTFRLHNIGFTLNSNGRYAQPTKVLIRFQILSFLALVSSISFIIFAVRT